MHNRGFLPSDTVDVSVRYSLDVWLLQEGKPEGKFELWVVLFVVPAELAVLFWFWPAVF